MSQEYISALAILVVTVLKFFGIEVVNDSVTGIIVGLLAIWTAYRRHSKGDISVLGARK